MLNTGAHVPRTSISGASDCESRPWALRGSSPQNAVRVRFVVQFKKPDFRIKAPLLTRPLTEGYGLAGAAFEYPHPLAECLGTM